MMLNGGLLAMNFPAHYGRHRCAQKFNGAQHLSMGQRPDGELHQKPVVPKELMLKEYLFENLLGASYKVGAA